jgi:4-carboxymuconolactone decarboxylase
MMPGAAAAAIFKALLNHGRAGRRAPRPGLERKEPMADSTGETPVLDLLANMTADSVAVSSLDPEALILARIAALVAVDAPAVSYVMNLGAAADFDIDPERIRGVLSAIAPIVGTARVVSATTKIVEALAISIETAQP